MGDHNQQSGEIDGLLIEDQINYAEINLQTEGS